MTLDIVSSLSQHTVKVHIISARSSTDDPGNGFLSLLLHFTVVYWVSFGKSASKHGVYHDNNPSYIWSYMQAWSRVPEDSTTRFLSTCWTMFNIICPASSFFSSLPHIVSDKIFDDWHPCGSYRALNHIIIFSKIIALHYKCHNLHLY